ncbi:unnamed protein product [Leptidea sinapis]|uniref:SWIM-type domain-containing protein n=1 Tax=Leptidea sinapis TaxID=189913 RepID=A0A5E4QM30_9NEOP|nr:unnamed protein product [Leptidea sinapis]
MDKKSKKKTVIKRKSDEQAESEKKKMVKNEDEKNKVEVVNQVIEVPVEQGQQIVHTGQLVEGNFEQPVFVNMKGEPVQLGPNTVILYEQSGNPSNFAFGGMWTMDSSGRIVMAETIYDVKGEPEEEGNSSFVQATPEVNNQQQVDESGTTYQQYEINSSSQVDGTQEFEVAIIDNTSENNVSPSGCFQCLYYTTPNMQLAFNAVPQFLCIETGISTLMTDDLTWLLETFKSCNPAWRQVRCVVCDPTKCQQGLERLVGKLKVLIRNYTQPDDFVSLFFNVANQLEEERRMFALSKLRYAYNLMSHQTKLAQKCLDDRAGRKHNISGIIKYGTSTQECSCLFSKVFRLPCRHILMLTTELKVKTHIPFEPRWTVQHCLFGCESTTNATTTTTATIEDRGGITNYLASKLNADYLQRQ